MSGIFIIPTKNLKRIFKKSIRQPGYALSAFLKRFRSYMTYLFGRGCSAPPETISLFLTRRCNLRCTMCGQWGESGSFKGLESKVLKDELSIEDVKMLLYDLKGFRPNITLFGGEPMLYPHWIEVVRLSKKLGMRCNMVSNCVLLKRYAEEILDAGLDEIILSLDGPQDIHESMRGVDGTFGRVMEGVGLLNRKKRERNLKKPMININCTIYEANYERLEEVVGVAEGIGADAVTFHHFLFLSKDMCDRHNGFFEPKFGNRCGDWYGFVRKELPSIDTERLIEIFEKIRNKKSDVDVSFYPNFTDDEIRRYYTGWEFESSSYPNRCLSLWMAAYIFPDGSVRPYHSMEFVPGNIKEEAFTHIWNNKRYREYRRTVKAIKRFPVCSKGCTELYRY